ncbi:hypothetical protein LIER_24477 [Lithospermum erythrorhizon]|uniref:Uncharacterized protein n=1 Tax=Lithospermum erythrorhizon TaxID=34254 RepID=A0AAV3R4Z2_LITER
MSDTQFGSREVCFDGSICSEKSVAGNTFGYQLGRFPETGLSFLGNHQDGEDPNNPLYYNWADIDNYEDVDDMYRSSDSTSKLGTRHGDDLGWFSISGAVEGTEDAPNVPCSESRSLKRIFENDDISSLDFVTHSSRAPNVPCSESRSLKRIFENDDISSLDFVTHSSRESDLQESSATYKGTSLHSINYEEPHQLNSSAIKRSSCLLVEDNSSQPGLLSFSTYSSCQDGNKYIPKAQIDEQNKKMKCQNQSGKSWNQLSENDSFFYAEDISKSGQQPAQKHDGKPFGYWQGDTPYMCSVYSCSSDITSLQQPLTAIESENISLTSLSLDDFYESDGVQYMKGSVESLLQETSSASGDPKDQMYQLKGFKAFSNDNPKDLDMAFPMCMSDTISKDETVNSPATNECNGDISMRMSAKSDGSCEQENSESLEVDDISVGATSFRQLQLVMSQLDPKTKLCLRDSLYRLAWSAEQRNYYESLKGGFIDDRDSMSAEGRTMNMEMETDTNPMDRSIAHLLFHRPVDQSVLAG